jgi:hypothetical protein
LFIAIDTFLDESTAETSGRERGDETRSHPNLTERDSLHELLVNQFSSVAWKYVEEAYQIKSVLPMDN